MIKDAGTHILDPMGPFNIRVMEVSAFIAHHNLLPVTSMLIQEPSSNEFNQFGLFSEEIFGKVGTLDRMLHHGYIELNTTIIAPVIYRTLTRMGTLYTGILSGQAYATFNEETKDFDRVYGDPEETPGADTGFEFFCSHLHEFKPKLTESLSRETSVGLIESSRGVSLQQQYLVHPAGLRDISADGGTGRLIQDDINKLYLSLLAYANSIPKGSTSPLYDSIRYRIQAKAMEIYEYLLNQLTGKRGFYRGSFTARRIAMGTRNVISAASFAAPSPDHPQALKPDESYVGVYQTIKGLQPAVFHGIKKMLVDPIFGEDGSASRVALVDPDTNQLVYATLSEPERMKFVSEDGINAFINDFKNTDRRDRPITVKDIKGKVYYLALVYDEFDRVAVFSSIDDLKTMVPNYDPKKIRPLTWVEIFYLLGYEASYDKYAFLTRYPVMSDGSCYPTKVHLVSTTPGRVVDLVDLLAPDFPVRQYPEYPIVGRPYRDTVVPHSDRLQALGGDFDGDKRIVAFMSASIHAVEYFSL